MSKSSSTAALTFAALCLSSISAQAASFDCGKASSNNEHLICSEPLLSSMDEQYSAVYRYLLDKTKQLPTERRTIVSAAVAAFRSREETCSDARCLRRWYQAGRERLSQQLWKIEPALMQKPLSPRALYTQLNLLTFGNIDHPRLRFLNKRYLADLYPESSVAFDADQLRIEHEDSVWVISIKGDTTIEIDNRILNASYRSTQSVSLYYDPVASEFRAGMPEYCNLYSQGSKPDQANQTSLQHASHGEIDLSVEVPIASIPVFTAPNGKHNGTLNLEVKADIEKQTLEPVTYPIIRICNTHSEDLTTPAYVIRLKYEERLLFFDQQGDWINLSHEAKSPAWITVNDLPESLRQRVRSREYVMLQASNIRVRSPHRLRAEPSTNSDILHVLTRSDRDARASIEPVDILGDWMKVRYTTPNPLFETEPAHYEHRIGWIKWRERPGKEYVDVQYSLGL